MRRTKRLVAVAAAAAAKPAGKVTEVLHAASAREAAYRLMSNDAVSATAIADAARLATAQRAGGMPFVYAPLDQTDLRVTDRDDAKHLGRIGDASSTSRGLQVMSAIGVAPDGTPLGMLGQVMWAREPARRQQGKDRRPPEERESIHWLECIERACTALAGTTRPWFQIDRAADSWQVLLEAQRQDCFLTVRSSSNRRLRREGSEQPHLWDELAKQAPLGSYNLDVVGTPNRKPRIANMLLQASEPTLNMQLWPVSKRRIETTVWAVRAVEVGTTPAGEQPIEWTLLTTYPVRSLVDAHAVVAGYTTRWLVEQFHKTWKSGACNVEDTQLGEAENIERWATILASVAMRLLRLTYLGRRRPELPATVELNRAEIDAVILLRKPKGIRRGSTPIVGDVVRWIAELGGYTGKSSGGPPGAIVLSRGLAQIRPVAQILAAADL